MYKKILPFLFFIPCFSFSQTVLTIEEAVKTALEKNFDIEINALEQKASDLEIYKANAGMLPNVDWNANLNGTVNQVNQKFSDGRPPINRFGRAIAPNTNVSLSWVLYNGGKMDLIYERLKQQSQLTHLESRLVVQNLVTAVLENYYTVVRQKETVAFLNTVIKYYEERLKITEERWAVGSGSKLDFLQSKTDLYVQKSALAAALSELKAAKIRLNNVLNRDNNIEFDVEKVGPSGVAYQLEDLISKASIKNRELALLDQSIRINQVVEKEWEADKKPTINFNSSAGYLYNNTNAGFFLSNQNISLNAGFSARWNLYDGGHTNRRIEIAKLNTQIIEANKEKLLAQIKTNINVVFNQYLSDKEILQLEEENKVFAEENLSISLEKFRLGGSGILELNEAQRSYDAALNRLVNAQFNIKISELRLMALSGDLAGEIFKK